MEIPIKSVGNKQLFHKSIHASSYIIGCGVFIQAIAIILIIISASTPVDSYKLIGNSKPTERVSGSGKWDWQWRQDGYEIISDIKNSVSSGTCRFLPNVRMPLESLSQVPMFNTILQVC